MEDKNGKKTNRNKQSQSVKIMFLTVVGGVMLCLTVFFVVFASMNKKNTVSKIPTETTSNISQTTNNLIDQTTINKKEAEILAVITSLSPTNKKINLYDFEKDKELSLIMKAGAEMKDQYGNVMTLSEFVAGDIVEIVYDENSMQYEKLKLSSRAWKQNSISGLKINIQSSTIALGNKTYKYNNKLTTRYKESSFDISTLDAIDIVTVKGYDNTIWSIELEKGHGYLVLTSKDKIQDGSIEIDTNIFRPLDSDNKIKILEGEHKLVVKGSNMEPYTKQFSIKYDEQVSIDLSDVKIKSGIVNIKSNVDDYIVYVDDKQQDENNRLVLKYGKYDIKLTKEGYHDIVKEVIVNKDNTTVTFNMEAIIPETTEPETESKTEVETTQKVQMGVLSVKTTPEDGANIFVDNALVGISPLTIKLEHGEHKVTVRKDGFTDISITVNISSVQSDVNITLHPTSTAKTIESTTENVSTSNKENESTSAEINVVPIY